MIDRAVLSICAVACILTTHVEGITVQYSPGASFATFERSDGSPLDHGHLHAGYFQSDPSGLDPGALRDNFVLHATFGTDSGTTGFFNNGDFPWTPISEAANRDLYLLVTDTTALANATEIAVFTNTTDTNWTFPSTAIPFPLSLSMTDIINSAAGSSILAGKEDTQYGAPSVQLEPIPTPLPPAPEITLIIISGQPGIEFAFPSSQAGSVTFTLQSSDTLLPDSFVDVAATPSVISDDGTTQTIRILHPDPVSGHPKRFLRLKVTSN